MSTYIKSALAGFILAMLNMTAVMLTVNMFPQLSDSPPAAKAMFESIDHAYVVAWMVFIGPLFETVLAQVIPISIIANFTKNIILCALLSAVIFAALHVLNGGGFFQFVITLCNGMVFSLFYLRFRSSGALRAFIAVSIIHAVNNLSIYLIS